MFLSFGIGAKNLKLTIKSTSRRHGVAIPGLGVTTGPIQSGYESEVEFIADKAGSYDYYCNIPCGAGHREMIGKYVVN